MKKLIRMLAMMLAVALMLGCAAFAEEAPRAINAYKAPADIAIDGDLTEWNTTSPATINVEAQVVRDPGQWKEKGAEDLSLDVYVMWDAENLYLGAKILDDTPFMYREGFPPDMADSLVLFMSTDPAASKPERGRRGEGTRSGRSRQSSKMTPQMAVHSQSMVRQPCRSMRIPPNEGPKTTAALERSI